MAREILIKIDDKGHPDVWVGDRHTGTLTWGELLEQVGELTHPQLGKERFAMHTDDEWAARETRRRRERSANAPNPAAGIDTPTTI